MSWKRAPAFACTLLLSLAVGCAPGEQPPPNVLLITLDTLRADHLVPYGSRVTGTPNAARLAAEGTLFENAAAPLPLTRPSHATLFTSLHPRRHGVADNHLALPDEEQTLAEVLRDSGYRTGAFIGSPIVGPHSGLLQGFDHVEGPPKRQPGASPLVEAAVGWLRSLGRDEAFFAWIHIYDPHMPYAPHPFYAPPPAPGDAGMEHVSWGGLRDLARRNGGALGAEVLARARHLYAAEVTATDAALALLLMELDERRLAERTVTVLTADHGECFEKGFFFRHGPCLYEGSVRVPLIVRYPGRVPAGERRIPQVRHVDVAPTVLTLAGLEVPGAFRGESLFRRDGAPVHLPAERTALVQHPVSAERQAAARRWIWHGIETVAGVPMRRSAVGAQLYALRSARWKYLAGTDGPEELYDLEADPGETRNLAGERRETVRRLRSVLRERLEELPLEVLEPQELSPAVREELEALGYL